MKGDSASVHFRGPGCIVFGRVNLLGGPFIQIRMYLPVGGGVYPNEGNRWMFESILCQVTEYDSGRSHMPD